jgi:hypothetical protein
VDLKWFENVELFYMFAPLLNHFKTNYFMKKLLLVATFMVAGFIGANAQSEGSGFHFGVGINLAVPIGDFGDLYSFGIGGEVQGEYMFSEKISGIINSGYTGFIGKKFDFGFGEERLESVGLIPIIAGVRVYPSSQIFIGARAGLGILTGGGDSETGFAYRPEIGYNGGPIQIALSFNGLSKDGSSLNHIGLTAIYVFGGVSK